MEVGDDGENSTVADVSNMVVGVAMTEHLNERGWQRKNGEFLVIAPACCWKY